MRRSAQLVAAVVLLVVLVAVPAMALACASNCVDAHPAAASAAASCHETRADAPRFEGAAANPCASHDLASAEPATRTQPREEASAAVLAVSSSTRDRLRAGGGTSAITPGSPRPAPSRPPLVLRL